MIIKTMKLLIVLITLLCGSHARATGAAGYQSYSWITSSLDALTTLFNQCLEVPKFNLFNSGTVSLDAAQSGNWVPANVKVQSGKAIEFTWDAGGLTKAPQKFLVMYRVDPRFNRPQLFILTYNYSKQAYVSDFHNFPVGSQACSCTCSDGICSDASASSTATPKPPACALTCSKSSNATAPTMLLSDCEANLNTPAYFVQCMQSYRDFFNLTGTGAGRASTMKVNSGDIVSINLTTSDVFFGAGTEFTGELKYDDHLTNIASIYTTTNLPDNQLIYASSSAVCKSLFSGGSPPSGTQYTCASQGDSSYLYSNLGGYPSLFLGLLDSLDIVTSTAPVPNPAPTTITLPTTIYPCPSTLTMGYNSNSAAPIYSQASSLCFYEGGAGILVKLGGTSINPSYLGFTQSPFTGKYFFYYQSSGSGALDFTTDWMMGSNTSPKMFAAIDPTTLTDGVTHASLSALQAYTTGSAVESTNSLAKFMHFGRYFMEVEVGGSAPLAAGGSDNVDVLYTITKTASPPSPSTVGLSTNNGNSISAYDDGYLWLQVVNPNIAAGNNISGNITVNYTNYTGSTILSTTLNTYLIVPIIASINDLMTQFYIGLAGNATLHSIATTSLTLYVILYALYFLAGATQVKTMDLITRVIKITVIVALFKKDSWDFFNDNFFNFFVGGCSYLINNIIGLTSNPDNIFGFLDIIFVKYLDLHLWRALGIQLLQLPSGLTFFALMVIAGIWIYFRAVLEVVIGYIMAFLSMAVMISLAPIFITFMLFERTKHLFNNWISALLNCMLQPTILLIFFLLIDQIMTQQLYGAVTECCWGWLIDLELNLSFKPALDFSLGPVPFPFLPGIPFFIPQLPNGDIINGTNGAYLSIASSSIMFYCYAVMSKGLINYVTSIVAILTGVGVGGGVAGQSAADSITADLQGHMQKDGTLRGGLRAKITGDINPNTGNREGGIGGGIAGVGRAIKGKTIDQNYGADTEDKLRSKRTADPDKGDNSLRDKIANRKTRYDFKSKD